MDTTELLHVSQFPSSLHDNIADKVAAFTVGLTGIDLRNGNEVAAQSGSGTLVEVAGRFCIFTADHVVESIARKPRISLFVDWSGGFRRCAFDVNHLQFVRLPRGPTEESGPDLAAIVLPIAGEAIATLRSLKIFYNLDKRIAAFNASYASVKEGFWFPCGVLGEGTQQLPPTRGFVSVTGHWGMCAVAASPNEQSADGFDYLELRAHYDAGQDLPSTFGGMSGGGLWQAKVRKSVEGELYLDELIYSGVIFYESAVVGGMRKLKCHGRASVHERLVEAMRN